MSLFVDGPQAQVGVSDRRAQERKGLQYRDRANTRERCWSSQTISTNSPVAPAQFDRRVEGVVLFPEHRPIARNRESRSAPGRRGECLHGILKFASPRPYRGRR